MSNADRHFYEFGPFRLEPVARRLLRDDGVVPLNPKDFETLLVLIEQRGRVVEKEELMRQLWPDSIVEEANLSQHIYLLRKALGEGAQDHSYIVTVPGRGYRFVAQVREVREKSEGLAATEPVNSQTAVAAEPDPKTDPSSPEYVLGVEDRLTISVWRELDMVQTVVVRPDGKITFPLVGDVQAATRTARQLD